MHASGLHERLTSIVGQRSSRHVGELTGVNHETVRRYLQGQAPSVEFLTSLCSALGVSGDWLLTGRGTMKVTDARVAALRESDAGELLGALAEAVEKLIDRVDRLELLMHSMEVRLRAAESGPEPPEAGSAPRRAATNLAAGANGANGAEGHGADGEGSGRSDASTQAKPHAKPVEAVIPQRVLRLRDAFAKRSHPDAD